MQLLPPIAPITLGDLGEATKQDILNDCIRRNTDYYHVTRIKDEFLHSLNSHPSNWPSTIEAHALALLRSGEATTFPVLLKRVLEDVRHDTQAKATAAEEGKNGEANGTATNGNNKKAANGAASDANNLAIPATVVQDLLRVTREHLDDVVEIDEEGS